MRNLVFILLSVATLLSCGTPEARRPVTVKTGSRIDESVARNKERVAQEDAFLKKIIASDSVTWKASSDGFWYRYEIQDPTDSFTAQVGDQVTFTYDIRDINETMIYPASENGVINYQIDQDPRFSTFRGMREALKLLKVGETVHFIFPSYTAYGYYGYEDRIGSNMPLRSTITMISIENNN